MKPIPKTKGYDNSPKGILNHLTDTIIWAKDLEQQNKELKEEVKRWKEKSSGWAKEFVKVSERLTEE